MGFGLPALAPWHAPYPRVATQDEQRRQEPPRPCPQQSPAPGQGSRDLGTSGDLLLPGHATSKDQKPMWLCVGMPRSHLPRNASAQRVNGTKQVPHHLSLPVPLVPWLGAVLGGRRAGQGPAPAKSPPSRSALRSNQRRQGERAEWEVRSRLGQRVRGGFRGSYTNPNGLEKEPGASPDCPIPRPPQQGRSHPGLTWDSEGRKAMLISVRVLMTLAARDFTSSLKRASGQAARGGGGG